MISVIIPAHNAEACLSECLDSLLSQTFTDWEAVVVENGSTDSTLEVARGYAVRDRRIHIISLPSGNVSVARNAGLRNSAGKYVTFLDSDDCLYPHALEIFNENAPKASIVCGEIVKGPSFNPSDGASEYGDADRRTDAAIFALERGLYQTTFNLSACAKLFPRHLFEDIRFKENVRYEDLEIMPRLLLQDVMTVMTVDVPVYFYRHNPSSFSNTFTPATLDVVDITADIEALVNEKAPCIIMAARDRRLSACFHIFSILGIHDPGGRLYGDIRKACWRYIRTHRLNCIVDDYTRRKNKLGCLLSYLGSHIFSIVSRRHYSR